MDYGASTCAVCLDDSCALDTTLFPCGHSFHGECLIQWVRVQNGRKFNCPLCRRDIAHFVPNSSNQAINDQLVEIWDEQNLYKPAPAPSPAPAVNDDVCCTSKSVECTIPVETIAPPTHSLDQDSIWQFLWNSPSSIVARRKKLSVSSSTATASSSTPWICEAPRELDVSFRTPFRASQPFEFVTRPTFEIGVDSQSCWTPKENTASPSIDFSDTSESSASVNLRAGLFAGIAAGTTTYVATANKLFAVSALRGSLLPVLAETVPSVAVFFASYEALKSGVFGVNENKSAVRTFSERFASASMASTLGFVAPAVARTGGVTAVQRLLPLRFAFFFGTFEMCKDAMDTKHHRLGLSQIASAAAIGGTVSHALCYPMLERHALNVTMTSTSTAASASTLTRAAYRGWTSSLSKFLPSCVACSCAFEYGKRYLTTRTD